MMVLLVVFSFSSSCVSSKDCWWNFDQEGSHKDVFMTPAATTHVMCKLVWLFVRNLILQVKDWVTLVFFESRGEKITINLMMTMMRSVLEGSSFTWVSRISTGHNEWWRSGLAGILPPSLVMTLFLSFICRPVVVGIKEVKGTFHSMKSIQLESFAESIQVTGQLKRYYKQ